MASSLSGADSLTAALGNESVATVRRWLAESRNVKPDASAARLAGLLKDPRGLPFTLGFVDRVVRPEDLRVAARNLERLSREVPKFLPWYMRAALVLGGVIAPLLPWLVVPIARRVLRQMVGHLIIDATPEKLGPALERLRSTGVRLNLNLLGEAVLGDAEADRRLAGTRALLERDDVDYVSIKVSSVASQLSMWGFDETVDRVVSRLLPLYEYAAAQPSTKFINLDMEEYRDLDLTVAVFQKLLAHPPLHRLEAGIVLQAYLPDALAALQRLTEWAVDRRARGGAGIKVRVVKGANLAMERVDATMHGWPLATWGSKRETDTNYKRVLDYALRPEHTDAVRLGIAGHNLFDIAFAWLLARERRVEHRVDIEMLLGMATAQADAVRRDVKGLLLYTPVVHPHEFDSAISYLVRRLEENASSENFMSGIFDLHDEQVFEREGGRFLASLADLDETVPLPHRVQDRTAEYRHTSGSFANEPDTDPALAVNREWGRRILDRVPVSVLGGDTLAAAKVGDPIALEQSIVQAAHAADAWALATGHERNIVLRRAADSLAARRAELIEVMARETGKTIAEADVEVSEAVDFARYYADRAVELDEVEGATFEPAGVVVVTPPWNFPVAIPAGGVLAALAAGSAVILKPAPQARRCAAVLAEALWAGGVPKQLLSLVDLDEGELGRALVSDPRVGRVILTGSWETAALFRSWRADLPLLAETSGKNSIVVTPSADLDLAVADVVRSAFGHAGQKCSAASLVILVGSVATSERFRRQLVDAVTTLRVAWPHDPLATMGPVIEPPSGKLLSGLTELAPGESWLVAPQQLDETGRLWSPGLRDGVQPGSEYHLTEYFGPILGIMTARDLPEAIELQNATPYGLTAGIHSLDPEEVAEWIDGVQAGNLYVNRGITGAIVRRQPFGGWKRSTVGASAKAGGPNYLATLGSWKPIEVEPSSNLRLDGISPLVQNVILRAQPGLDFEQFAFVRRAALSDERAWVSEFGLSRDVSSLGVERNLFRYLPVPVTLRLAEDGSVGDLIRLVAAAARAQAPIAISTAVPLPAPLLETVRAQQHDAAEFTVESDAAWLERASGGGIGTARVRLVGGDASALATAVRGDPDLAIWSGPVTASGRVELLTFLHEQAISVTAHRFGNPDQGFATLPV